MLFVPNFQFIIACHSINISSFQGALLLIFWQLRMNLGFSRPESRMNTPNLCRENILQNISKDWFAENNSGNTNVRRYLAHYKYMCTDVLQVHFTNYTEHVRFPFGLVSNTMFIFPLRGISKVLDTFTSHD